MSALYTKGGQNFTTSFSFAEEFFLLSYTHTQWFLKPWPHPSSIIMGEGSAIWARAYRSLLQRRLLIGILSSLVWVASKASSRNILGKRDTYPNSKNRLIHLVRKEKV
jgi:hypothetical protein